MVRFVEENDELPSALRSLVAYYRSSEGRGKLDQWARLATGKASLQFAGMGTSEFTSEAIAWRLTAQGRCARSFDAGELYHQELQRPLPDAIFILTSQSGESVEIRNLASLDWIGPCVAVTNDVTSSLARGAALTLPLCAGQEDAITTKTYTNNLALFRLLESRLEGSTETDHMLDALDQVAEAMEEIDVSGIEAAACRLCDTDRIPDVIAFTGRGDAVVSARQSGLTFMEGLKRPTCSYAGGAFRHGPFEAVGPGLGLILFRSSQRTAALVDGLALDASAHGSPVVMIDGCGLPDSTGQAVIHVPRTTMSDRFGLFPLLAARSHNHLLHVLATRLGIATGIFRYGGKVTNKE